MPSVLSQGFWQKVFFPPKTLGTYREKTVDISRLERVARRQKENDPARVKWVCHHRVSGRVATRGRVDSTVRTAQRCFALKLMTNQTCKFTIHALNCLHLSTHMLHFILNNTFYALQTDLSMYARWARPLCYISSCVPASVLKVRAVSGLIASLLIKTGKKLQFHWGLGNFSPPDRPVVAEASMKTPCWKINILATRTNGIAGAMPQSLSRESISPANFDPLRNR